MIAAPGSRPLAPEACDTCPMVADYSTHLEAVLVVGLECLDLVDGVLGPHRVVHDGRVQAQPRVRLGLRVRRSVKVSQCAV